MRGVIEGIKPEFEGGSPPSHHWSQSDPPIAIHACLSSAAAVAEIPAILRGEALSPKDPEAANLTTQNFSKKPAAIVLGGGYNEEDGK